MIHPGANMEAILVLQTPLLECILKQGNLTYIKYVRVWKPCFPIGRISELISDMNELDDILFSG